MKRLCLLLSTTAAISLLASHASAADKSAFDGAYAGVQAGYVNNHIDSTYAGAGSSAGVSMKSDLGVSGLDGGIFAGYGTRVNQFYVGIEGEGSLSDASSTDRSASSSITTDTSLKNSGSYAASLRVGLYPADNLLVYGRVGAARGKFELSDRETVSSTTSTVSKNEWLNGLRLGLGAETTVMPNVTARADWAYTDYEEMTVRYPGSGTSHIDPNSNTFRVGVAYHF